MGVRHAYKWRWWRGGFVAFPHLQPTCDTCGRDTVEGETDACKRCRADFAAIAERLRIATGIPLTLGQVKSLGFGPRPPRFRYGKPWHRHIPPHEREKLGLHT